MSSAAVGLPGAHSVRVDGRDVHGGRGDRPDEHPPSSALAGGRGEWPLSRASSPEPRC